MKKLIVLAMFLVLLIQVVSAEEYLAIKKITVYVDGDKVSGIDDEGGDIDNVLPESEIKVKVEIENNYPTSTKEEIQDIEYDAIIYEIDDGDDLEEDDDVGDIKAGKDDTVEIVFEIPLEVEEGDYEMELFVIGENETGGELNDSAFFTVKIEKEKHDVRIYKADLGLTELKCNRNTDLRVRVINFGSNDEEDIELTIKNDALGISAREMIDELTEDLTDDDSKFSKTYSITVPDDAKAGTYNIDIRVGYDDGDESDEETLSLTVQDCETAKPEEKEETKPETTKPAEKEETTTVVQTQPVIPTAAVVATPAKESFWESNKYTMLVVLAYVVVIIVAVLIVTQLVKKR